MGGKFQSRRYPGIWTDANTGFFNKSGTNPITISGAVGAGGLSTHRQHHHPFSLISSIS